MRDPLHIFARIHPKPEHFNEARAAILEIIPRTLNEPGCQRFELLEGMDDGSLYLFEEFDDEAALDAHHAEPYTQAVFRNYESWLEEPVQLTRMRSCT